MDYTNFLPGDLEQAHDRLRSVYTLALAELDDAFVNPVLQGVDMKTPYFPFAKGIFNEAALDMLPITRDINSYSVLVTTLIPAIPDTKALAQNLLPLTDGWKTLDIDKLRAKNHSYRLTFTSYLPVLDPVIQNLSELCNELRDHTSAPSWWNKSLYNTVVPLLKPIATFAEGTAGQSTLAGILHLQLEQVSEPLCKVVESGSITLKVIIAAIEKYLVVVLQQYRRSILLMSHHFGRFVDFTSDVIKARESVLDRLKQEAAAISKDIVSAEECVAAWKGASEAAEAFINVIAGGKTDRPPVDVSTLQLQGEHSSTTSRAVDIIPELKEAAQQISAKVEEVGQLPLIDYLQIVVNEKSTESVGYIVDSCRKKGGILQELVQKIICDMNGYCLFMKVLEPVLNNEAGIPTDLEARLSTFPQRFRRSNDNAITLSQEIFDQLDMISDKLSVSISKTKVLPTTDGQDYSQIYEHLRSIFAVKMAGTFIGSGNNTALYNQNGVSGAIDTAALTLKALQDALPFFQNLNVLMKRVSGIWDELLAPLTSRKTSQPADDLDAIQAECQSCIETIGNPANKERYRTALRDFKASPNAKDPIPKLKQFLSSGDFAGLKEGLSPPSDMILGVNRATLNGAASDYRYIGSILSSRFPDLASASNGLASQITSQLIPKLTTVIQFYIDFSLDQEDPFTGGLDKQKLEQIIARRSEQLATGESLAKAAENTFLQFNWDSESAFNDVTRKMAELNDQLRREEAELRRLREEYAKYEWLEWIPGIGDLILMIIELINQTERRMAEIQRVIYDIRDAQSRLSAAQSISNSLRANISALSQGWSSLTTKTQVLKDLVKSYEENPALEAALKPVVKAEWVKLRENLNTW